MTERDDLTQLLATVERTLGPTDIERERARAKFRHALEAREGDTPSGSSVLSLDELRRVDDGTAEPLDVLIERSTPQPDRWAGRRAMTLVAAALVIVVGIGIIVSNQQPDVVDTTDVSDEQPEPDSLPEEPDVEPGASGSPAILIDGSAASTTPLAPGRYAVVLGDTEIQFELRDDRFVRRLEADMIVLEAASQGIGPSPKVLTIAIGNAEPSKGDIESWLTDLGIEHEGFPASAAGRTARDIELTVDDPDCDPNQPCLPLPIEVSDPNLLALIDGENRLLVLPLEAERLLVALDTSGGNRSGNSQRAYNTIINTLSISR